MVEVTDVNTTLVLGASGFLGRHVREALVRNQQRVIGVSRRPDDIDSPALDVTDPRARDARHWRRLLKADLPQGAIVTSVVNLVTKKSGDSAAVEHVNVCAVRAMAAIKEAVAELGDVPWTLHVGSVSEYRRGGKAGAYAAAKRAARAACIESGIDAVLTVGPVTGRIVRTPHSQALRNALRFLPRLRSNVRIGVTSIGEAAEAIAVLAQDGSLLTGGAASGRAFQLALAGHDLSWGRYLDLPDRPEHWFPWEPAVWRLLAGLEGNGRPWVDRLGSMARIAMDPASSHYRLTANRAELTAALPAGAGRRLNTDWHVVWCDRGAGPYLLKHRDQ
jgi:hypothetical protein